MARRGRRRFHRAKPDMGWIIGTAHIQAYMPDTMPDSGVQVVQLFDFADIDPEALTGRIEADKSDWFLKRCILNMYGVAQLNGLSDEDTMRLWEWGLSTQGLTEAADVANYDHGVFSAEWYNQQARILRTGVAPAYQPGVIPYAVNEEAPEGGILSVTSTSGGVGASGWLTTAPFLGPARVSEDFTISNAGLRNNQQVSLTVSTSGLDPNAYDYKAGDTVYVHVHYQFLLQKRRA